MICLADNTTGAAARPPTTETKTDGQRGWTGHLLTRASAPVEELIRTKCEGTNEGGDKSGPAQRQT
jgi:hypothetical protein